LFPNPYAASFLYSETLYRFADTGNAQLPAPTGAATLVICQNMQPQPTEQETLFLNNILKAVGLTTPAQVQIIHIAPNVVLNCSQIITQFKPQKLLFFGFIPEQVQLNMRIGLYMPTPFNHTTLLFADALHLLESDKQKKSVLWQHLKQLFSV